MNAQLAHDKSRIRDAIDAYAPKLRELAACIAANPELGHEEKLASARLAEALEALGFNVERGTLGLETAFIAEYRSAKPGPTVALLAEYDALPEIGHACGHHLICTMALGAAAGLLPLLAETGGTLRVYGTPAEETKGAKVDMAAAGLFDDVDAALMAHPYHSFERSGSSLAMDALQYEFFGKAAHAAANPEDGINALDAVIQLFNGVGALRQQTRSDARIHGIVSHGGTAPNVIPDYAAAKFYVRAKSRAYTDELVRKVNACAEAAAIATGSRLAVSNYEYSYDELRTNEALSDAFTANLIEGGVRAEEIAGGHDNGSLDLGNVSLRCPAVHGYVKVADAPYALHSLEFRDAAQLPRAYDGMVFGAKTLALTAYDVLTDGELLSRIRAEFASASGSRSADRP
ncbi:M20 family metallopeptidase [Cohnella rhizosphaerae]|uniref:Peptidase M20 domain-containing protein 2 n=1 Tax=Cohnella rhizosphaerae TaxID=1457232 RepID=A0A9X4QQY3_9BACL|nr:M20 family metallopeptidase [Cohnella rhizosphaerae]MDG0808481.1 M20 family metallopeptidase [Cohnella rhizosphaerae]